CTAPLAPEPFGGPPGFQTTFPGSVAPKPVLRVTLDLPRSVREPGLDRSLVIGFDPLILQADVSLEDVPHPRRIRWRLTQAAQSWLGDVFAIPEVSRITDAL